MKSSPQFVRQAKADLRAVMNLKREELSPSEVLRRSQKISRRLLKFLSPKKVKNVAIFLPWKNEVSLESFWRKMWREGVTPLIPDTRKGLGRMTFVPFRPSDRLVRGRYGPLELEEIRRPVPMAQIDLMITPGLCFDQGRFRLGYGGGAYDRALPFARKTLKVGVGFDFQVLTALPRDPWDQGLDAVVTEKNVF